MNPSFAKFVRLLGKTRVALNAPLAPLTYMKVGGPADLLYMAYSAQELTEAVRAAIRFKIPYLILGGGSNVIVGDKGIRGLVIKNRADHVVIKHFKGKGKGTSMAIEEARVVAESGVITNLLVRKTIDEGLAGLEYFLGVPGTIGGAVFNNSHFQTELIGNAVETVNVLTGKGDARTYTNRQMRFAYDSSALQKTREVITSITFLLKGGIAKELWKKAEEYAKYRAQTQPLQFPSSGCMFKNVDSRRGTYGQSKKGLTSAGYLIEQAGLKGTKIGNAMVSEKHASFIINTGGASAQDVLKLANLVRRRVKEKFGVRLEMEVFKVGEFY